jgi:homoserine kinase type II
LTRIARLQIPSEAGDAISAWNVGEILTCGLVKRGVVNRNFIIRTSQGKYVLRQVSHVHHKSTRDLKFELSYLDYLKQSNFPHSIPSPIPTKNGGLFVTVQEHYYWLYKFLEGRVVERLNQLRLTQLAQMMAQYHALVESSNLHNGKPASDLYSKAATLKEIEENRTEILRKNKANRKENTFLGESARLTLMLRGFDDSPASNIGLYPIHRDLISENLIWKHGKLAGVIDFEHVSETNDPVVKDIAVTMQYCCRDKKIGHQLDLDSASRFLRAYMESHPLSDEEIVLIPDLITAGFAEDFVFAFWMLRNDPKRAKQSEEEGYGLTRYSRAAQWSHSNRERIAEAFLNER